MGCSQEAMIAESERIYRRPDGCDVIIADSLQAYLELLYEKL